MAKKREDSDKNKHPALLWIEKKGITRTEAAQMLGIPDKIGYLNQVLDRWRGTSLEYARLFHTVFGIPYEDLMNVKARPDPKTFRRQQKKARK